MRVFIVGRQRSEAVHSFPAKQAADASLTLASQVRS
jgi:hypothetical protein